MKYKEALQIDTTKSNNNNNNKVKYQSQKQNQIIMVNTERF